MCNLTTVVFAAYGVNIVTVVFFGQLRIDELCQVRVPEEFVISIIVGIIADRLVQARFHDTDDLPSSVKPTGSL